MKNANKRIAHDSALASLFDAALESMDTVRIMSFPSTFKDTERTERLDTLFCRVLLFEDYCHGVIRKLLEWEKTISEYQNEYDCSWRYYAISKRMDSIKKYGGDSSDYNEDGTIREAGEDELLSYSVISDLLPKCVDIVIDTNSDDLLSIYHIIKVNASLSISEMFSNAGFNLPMYKIGDDGEMVEMTFSDHAMDKASKEANSEMIVGTLNEVVSTIQYLIGYIKMMDQDEDNRGFFVWLGKSVSQLFNLDLKAIHKDLFLLKE